LFVGLLALTFEFCTDVVTARAALVSLYTFDNTADNAVAGEPSGSPEGSEGVYNGPQFSGTDGPIAGGKALKFDGTDDSLNLNVDAFPRTSAYGAKSNGIWTGSCSFWMKTADGAGEHIILGAARLGDNTTFEIMLQDGRLRLHVESALATATTGLFQVEQAPGPTVCCDDNWHHVVLTWNVTTGPAGTGSASIYVDGAAQNTVKLSDSITSADTFSQWNWPIRIGALGRDVVYRPYCFHGVLDDLALWNERLGDAKAKSLFNVAKDAALAFGVQDAQDLFEIFEEGPDSQGVVGGRSWRYATGLAGGTGEIVGNHDAVILDAMGNGVQVFEEPAAQK
jgi:hypothetical protein